MRNCKVNDGADGDSWNTFKLNFNQATIEQTADLLVSTGLRDAGYNYLVLDAGWQALSRDSNGRQQANSTRLPDGIPALVNYVHSRDLKFGLYSDAGCGSEFREPVRVC